MEITVKIHPSEDGRALFWAESPNFPGCFTEGTTIPETLRNWNEALALYISSYADPLEAYVSTPRRVRARRRSPASEPEKVFA